MSARCTYASACACVRKAYKCRHGTPHLLFGSTPEARNPGTPGKRSNKFTSCSRASRNEKREDNIQHTRRGCLRLRQPQAPLSPLAAACGCEVVCVCLYAHFAHVCTQKHMCARVWVGEREVLCELVCVLTATGICYRSQGQYHRCTQAREERVHRQQKSCIRARKPMTEEENEQWNSCVGGQSARAGRPKKVSATILSVQALGPSTPQNKQNGPRTHTHTHTHTQATQTQPHTHKKVPIPNPAVAVVAENHQNAAGECVRLRLGPLDQSRVHSYECPVLQLWCGQMGYVCLCV